MAGGRTAVGPSAAGSAVALPPREWSEPGAGLLNQGPFTGFDLSSASQRAAREGSCSPLFPTLADQYPSTSGGYMPQGASSMEVTGGQGGQAWGQESMRAWIQTCIQKEMVRSRAAPPASGGPPANFLPFAPLEYNAGSAPIGITATANRDQGGWVASRSVRDMSVPRSDLSSAGSISNTRGRRLSRRCQSEEMERTRSRSSPAKSHPPSSLSTSSPVLQPTENPTSSLVLAATSATQEVPIIQAIGESCKNAWVTNTITPQGSVGSFLRSLADQCDEKGAQAKKGEPGVTPPTPPSETPPKPLSDMSSSIMTMSDTTFCTMSTLYTHVSAETREKICKNQYVDIWSLGSKEHAKIEKEKTTEKVRKPWIPRTFNNWLQGFLTLAQITARNTPEKGPDLFTYIHSIFGACNKYGGDAWWRYDEDFRLRMAEKPELTWATKATDVWLEFMMEQKQTAPLRTRPFLGGAAGGAGYNASSNQKVNGTCWLFNEGQCWFMFN